MNLNAVYEIFYPGKCEKISIWKVPQKEYRSKKDFFEDLLPIEIRWINSKIWNDKARRSRFLSDCKRETKYLGALRTYFFEQPWTISRIEAKARNLLSGQIHEEAMNEGFLKIIEEEKIEISRKLMEYLVDSKTKRLKTNWENVVTFYVLLALFPEEINQIYMQYLYHLEYNTPPMEEEAYKAALKKDCALFQYEYPPDMCIVSPGEKINHTWIVKNVGETVWKDRYYECKHPMMDLDEGNKIIRIPKYVYPGDKVSPGVSFFAPDKPGAYVMNWKMKDSNGKDVFPDKLGLGLHFMVMAFEEEIVNPGENYTVIEEVPKIPATIIAGNRYSHTWVIQNTGETVWNEYYLECINGDNFSYAKKELRVPFKTRVLPGEKISVKVEFATPPVEGVYSMVWQIVKRDGTPAFSKSRRLEVLLNLI